MVHQSLPIFVQWLWFCVAFAAVLGGGVVLLTARKMLRIAERGEARMARLEQQLEEKRILARIEEILEKEEKKRLDNLLRNL
jgi:hypothetical protein